MDAYTNISWNLGTCIPKAVIEYLNTWQPQIRCLEVCVDSTCLGRGHLNIHDLHGFKDLQRIRWVGDYEGTFKALGKLLNDNAPTLKEIEIDEIGCGGIRHNRGKGNSLLNEVLELPPDNTQQKFPSLKKLELSAICLANGCDGVPSVFSLRGLTSLALKNCPASDHLLRVLSSDDPALPSMQLKAFEFSNNGLPQPSRVAGSVIDFLLCFKGLKDLFVSFTEHFGSELTDAILNHKSSLRRLVCHYPKINASAALSLCQPQCLYFTQLATEMAELSCLGVNLPPNDLVSTQVAFEGCMLKC